MRETYFNYFSDYTDADTYALIHHDDPHPKRILRRNCWMEINTDGTRTKRLWVKSIRVKFKKDEWAKAGKRPRCIGDLGVAASLQGFKCTEFLKKAMASQPLHHLGFTFEFCSAPEPTRLRQVFERLLNPDGSGYMVYFSDDSCISMRINGIVHVFNMDISSCDASHGPQLFRDLITITPRVAQDDMQLLVDQCRLPARILSVHNPANFVLLQADNPKLYSGSTITTIINNFANINIGLAVAEMYHNNNNPTPNDVIAAAATAGYIVTLEPCHTMYDIQFLKHSPVFDTDGELRALLNFGVLLRASGACHGDLPGRGDIETRGRMFQGALLHGMYPRTCAPVLEVMKSHTLTPTTKIVEIVNNLLSHKVVDEGDHYHVTNDEIWKRYRLAPADARTLEDGLNIGFGQSWACPATEAILQRDYGLSCETW
jgi:hypothetical protein